MAIEVVKVGGLTLHCKCDSDLKLLYSDLRKIEYCDSLGGLYDKSTYKKVLGLRCPVCNQLWGWSRASSPAFYPVEEY